MIVYDNIPCPWCNSTRVHTEFEGNHECDKWGYAICSDCSAQTGSIRTQYDASPDAPWRAEAIKEWNTRYQADERATNYPMQSIDDIPTEPAYFAPTSRATICAFCPYKDKLTTFYKNAYYCRECFEREKQASDPPLCITCAEGIGWLHCNHCDNDYCFTCFSGHPCACHNVPFKRSDKCAYCCCADEPTVLSEGTFMCLDCYERIRARS